MIPIFIISLPNADERRKKIEQQFEKIKLEFEWFTAVDGRKLSEETIQDMCDKQAIINAPNWLTRGALGCALSHYGVYQQIIKRNLPYALVMEDDILIDKKFEAVVQQCIPPVNSNKISLLYYQSWKPLELSLIDAIPTNGKHRLYKPVNIDQPITASAYIISLEACKTMVKTLLPIRFAADSWGDFYRNGGFQTLDCIYPSIINTSDAKSTIDYVRNKYLHKVLKVVDRYKIFPFYHLLKLRRKYNKQKMRGVELTNKKPFKF